LGKQTPQAPLTPVGKRSSWSAPRPTRSSATALGLHVRKS
jgi:hypothetical protein